MGGEEERGIDQSGPVKVSGRGREGGRQGDERGQVERWREGEMKRGRGWREELNEHANSGIL